MSAVQPNALESIMQSFSTTLHIHVLRALIEEIESVDPSHPTLAQLRFTLREQLAQLEALRQGEPSGPQPPALA